MVHYMNVRLYWDLAEHRGGLVLVAQNCLCLLIVKTGPWDGTIMRDPLFVVNAIVGLPPRTKRELSTCVVTCVRLLKVAGQLVCARLWESVKVLFDDVRGARPNAERDSFFTQCAFEVVPDGVVHIFFVLALEASADAKSEHLF